MTISVYVTTPPHARGTLELSNPKTGTPTSTFNIPENSTNYAITVHADQCVTIWESANLQGDAWVYLPAPVTA